MSSDKTYDFVIVGSGIGGLSSALILAKHNYSVLVLEKNHQIGGALQVFSRDKCVFDTGVHYIGGLDKGENLHSIFSYLGILDQLNLQGLDKNCFDLIRLPNGKSFPHAQGYENFEKHLIQCFPEEKQAILQFTAKMQEVCSYFPLYNLELTDPKAYYNQPEVLELGAWDYVSSITDNEELKIVLLGSGPLYAGDKKVTPFYVVALIMNSYIKGSYRLKDGGSQIAKFLSQRIREHQGELLKRKEVVSAEYDENRNVKTVVCSDGTRYSGKHFIANLHPSVAIKLFGEQHFRPAYKARINKLKNSVSALMVYFSMKEESFPYLNYNIYDHHSYDCWDTVYDRSSNWPHTVYMCTPASSKSDKFAESVCIMTYMNYEETKEWEDTLNTILSPSERAEKYQAFKAEKHALILDRMELRFPGFKDKVKNVYSSTPLTYKDYLGSPEGSLYGINKDITSAIATTINSKTRVPNLYLTGQNIVFHGILGASIGALLTCFNFIDPETLISKIKEHESKI